ncbi:hypothetical protein [Salinicoccus sp. Marseille-QA3877]
MNQLTIFDTLDRPTGLLHRCHLYHGDQFMYTAFPSLKGMKAIGIRSSEVYDMTADEYRAWIDENGYEERGVKP